LIFDCGATFAQKRLTQTRLAGNGGFEKEAEISADEAEAAAICPSMIGCSSEVENVEKAPIDVNMAI
jgi:hypothetical protein